MQPEQYERLMEWLSQPPALHPAPWGYEEYLTPHCRPEDVPEGASPPPTSSREIRAYLYPMGYAPALACAAKAFLVVAEALPFDAMDRRILPWINLLIEAALEGNQNKANLADKGLTRLLDLEGVERLEEGPLRDAVISIGIAVGMNDSYPVWDRKSLDEDTIYVYEMAIGDFAQTVMFLAAVYVQGLQPGIRDPWPLVLDFYQHWWSRCMCTAAYRDVPHTNWEQLP